VDSSLVIAHTISWGRRTGTSWSSTFSALAFQVRTCALYGRGHWEFFSSFLVRSRARFFLCFPVCPALAKSATFLAPEASASAKMLWALAAETSLLTKRSARLALRRRSGGNASASHGRPRFENMFERTIG